MKKTILTGLFAFVAAVVSAQTINPKTITFTASTDHNVVVGTTPIVDHYDFTVVSTSGPVTTVFTKGLGKPTPNAQNDITASLAAEFAAITSNGVFSGQVTAVGSGGTSAPASAPFGHVGPPAGASNLRYGS